MCEESEREEKSGGVCVCVRERERESVCVCLCESESIYVARFILSMRWRGGIDQREKVIKSLVVLCPAIIQINPDVGGISQRMLSSFEKGYILHSLVFERRKDYLQAVVMTK